MILSTVFASILTLCSNLINICRCSMFLKYPEEKLSFCDSQKVKTGQKSHTVRLVLTERSLEGEPFLRTSWGMSAPARSTQAWGKLTVPLFWIKACQRLSRLSGRGEVLPPGRVWSSAGRPRSSCPGTQELEWTHWRAPFQASASSWHSSLPPWQQGHLLCHREMNQEINSAQQRIAPPFGTACVSTHPASVHPLFLCEVASKAAQHVTPPAHHTHHFLFLPAISSHLPLHSLSFSPRAFSGSQNGLYPPLPPCIRAFFFVWHAHPVCR